VFLVLAHILSTARSRTCSDSVIECGARIWWLRKRQR